MTDKPTTGFIAQIAGLGGGRLILEIVLVVVGLCVLGFRSWVQWHDDGIIANQISKQSQSQIAQRNVQTAAKVKTYETLKRTVKTPQDAAKSFHEVADLPTPPIVFPPAPTSTAAQSSKQAGGGEPTAGGTASPTSPGELPEAPSPQCWEIGGHQLCTSPQTGPLPQGLYFPQEDVKPLFDRLADCKAMETQLGACQANFKDMTSERDAYKKAAKGGGFWKRLKSNAEFLVIGAGGGLIAICGTGHCK